MIFLKKYISGFRVCVYPGNGEYTYEWKERKVTQKKSPGGAEVKLLPFLTHMKSLEHLKIYGVMQELLIYKCKNSNRVRLRIN